MLLLFHLYPTSAALWRSLLTLTQPERENEAEGEPGQQSLAPEEEKGHLLRVTAKSIGLTQIRGCSESRKKSQTPLKAGILRKKF